MKASWSSFWLAAALLLPILAAIACWDWFKEHRPRPHDASSENS